MVLLARIITAPESKERRRNARRLVTLVASASQSSDREATVRIQNLSRTGLLLETDASFEIGEIFLLDLPEVGATPACVRRRQGQAYGCEFLSPVTEGALSAALLKSPFSTDRDEAGFATQKEIGYETSRSEPRTAAIFAIAIPFSVLLLAFAFTVAFLQFD